ncbi:MAG: DEAD/DEAH box helicase family protein [Acholeplasmatales bacterium]|nr:DEAD/DEAH box helicase family protein [Acholeplasmatales bacterium]
MNNINYPLYPEFNIDTISNVMSLRKPQKQSVKILDSILDEIQLGKETNLQNAADSIHDVYPIFKEFEHSFMSMTFALATGVGKTKLMGAFMTYLYTNKGIRNFFVVAPNLTIYNKLKNDLGNPASDNEKYVFRGVSCFTTQTPNIWADDDYRNRPAHAIGDSESINIFIFNISKFNSDERNMLSINEYLGQSFFDYLKSLDDLVLIMDESHHYRAKSSAKAINDLNPVLGLELTATPQVQDGSKTILFKNVVYEYPLSKAIKDGYTRTPYALTRRDINSYNFTSEELDKTMINDGIRHHENMKLELKKYSVNNGVKLVKPFMLIVCKDTTHAQQVLEYIQSDAFRNGLYKNKVIMVHSNQKGAEKEENIKLLLDVEKVDNPIEIVIHVNILKEGWDVNNLYTIVPLRTATSKTLREQTVGRGLRLPYGKRTGEKMIDSVTITAHDKFDEIIAEAQRGDSIFNAEGVIYAETERERHVVPVIQTLFDDNEQRQEVLSEAGLDHNNQEHRDIYNEIVSAVTQATNNQVRQNPGQIVSTQQVIEQTEKDLGERFTDNTDVQRIIDAMFGVTRVGENIINNVQERQMFIPKIRTEEFGDEEYIIQDFDLDLSQMNYVPIANEILIKNLLDSREETQIIKGSVIDFNTIKPEKVLVDGIREISEIDYEKCPKIIQKVVIQFLKYYRERFNEEEVRNIILMYKRDITNKFKNQLLQHLAVKYNGIVEVVSGIETVISNYLVDVSGDIKNINEEPEGDIRSITYDGARKSVTTPYKFDSNPERLFAIACENSPEVIQWLRPSSRQFNITYNRGHRYEPDFVVETSDMYYLVEVKDRRKLTDPDVVAKKERAIAYCKVASEYNIANGHKPFKYLFIPDNEVASNSSFNNLMQRFIQE